MREAQSRVFLPVSTADSWPARPQRADGERVRQVAGLPDSRERRVISRNVAKRPSEQWGRDASLFHQKWQEELESALEELGLRQKLKRVEHHLSHAANAYYTSGFDEALIVTLDGYGSGLAGSISVGRGGKIRAGARRGVPALAGNVLRIGHLGVWASSRAGTKARSSGWQPMAILRFCETCCWRDSICSRELSASARATISTSRGCWRPSSPRLTSPRAISTCSNAWPRAYVGHYLQQTGIRNLVLSGGVVANVKLNQRIRELPNVDGVVHSSQYGRRRVWNRRRAAGVRRVRSALATPSTMCILGPSSVRTRLRRRCRRRSLIHHGTTPIEPMMARLIADGKVVARFDGRMEYGPRALGNRSILYHAKEPEVNQWLNQRLGRTEFMPFAPATLYEKRDECYRNIDGADYAAQFMTLTFDCTEK